MKLKLNRMCVQFWIFIGKAGYKVFEFSKDRIDNLTVNQIWLSKGGLD